MGKVDGRNPRTVWFAYRSLYRAFVGFKKSWHFWQILLRISINTGSNEAVNVLEILQNEIAHNHRILYFLR